MKICLQRRLVKTPISREKSNNLDERNIFTTYVTKLASFWSRKWYNYFSLSSEKYNSQLTHPTNYFILFQKFQHKWKERAGFLNSYEIPFFSNNQTLFSKDVLLDVSFKHGLQTHWQYLKANTKVFSRRSVSFHRMIRSVIETSKYLK